MLTRSRSGVKRSNDVAPPSTSSSSSSASSSMDSMGNRSSSSSSSVSNKTSSKKVKHDDTDTSSSAHSPGAAAQVSLTQFFKDKTVSSLMLKTDVLIIPSDAKPQAAFHLLIQRHVQSAPVWHAAASKFIGFLDIRQLVALVVNKSRVPGDSEAKQQEKEADVFHPLGPIFDTSDTVASLCASEPFVAVHPDDSLVDVLTLLANGAHRVAVVPKEDAPSGQVLAIISQSSLIQYLQKHHLELSDELSVHVIEANIGSAPVQTVNESTSALEVFQTMCESKRSGIALVDAQGKLVGHTSGADLKLLLRAPKHMEHAMLALPIIDFLSQVRQSDVKEHPSTRIPVIAVSSDATLEKVIGKLAATQVHRIFVADFDQGYRPKRVISITDILRYFLSKIGK